MTDVEATVSSIDTISDIDTTTQNLVESPIPSATEPPVVDSALGTTTATITTTTTTTTTTTSSLKPKKVSSTSFTYVSPVINFEEDPNAYLKTKVESLIYWEYPKKSGAFLATSLCILILTQYYSILQIIAGFFTLVTGLNWVFVNTHKQGQKYIGGKSVDAITNPHSQRLEYNGTYIPRDRVLLTAQLTIDVVEVVAQKITKLVLIEDNWRSAISLVASYLVWTLAKYVSTKYLVGFFIVSAFTLPRVYLQHQDVIDAQVAAQTKHARVLAEKYGGVVTVKARELGLQASSFIKSKTSGAAASKKVE